MKMKIVIAVGVVVLCACCIAGGLYALGNYEKTYYTQVDNAKVAELPGSEEMRYEYVLDCYDESGRKKELKFKTSRRLRQDAYLSLNIWLMGVRRWEEVSYSRLPQAVQDRIR